MTRIALKMISELILLIAIAFSVGWYTLIFLRQKKQTDKQTGKQTKQHTGKQTNKQTDKQLKTCWSVTFLRPVV
jgi:arginine exporter protein ArgO